MKKENSAPMLTDNKMGTMSVSKLLLRMALPLAISMLVQAFYNVVDCLFVSMVSESAVTALSLAFSVQNLQIGFSTGIAVGMNSLLSKSLGEKNADRANRAAGNGILLTGIITLLFMLFGAFGTKAYYGLFDISAETMKNSCDYTAICSLFTIGLFVEILGERLLQASGKTL